MGGFDIKEWICPSKAEIVRLEIALVDLPGDISEMTTRVNTQGGDLFHPFTEDDDLALRKFLGVSREARGTFLAQYDEFLDLRRRFVYNINGYGNFLKIDDIHDFVEEASRLNQEFTSLRLKVMGFLEERCKGRRVSLGRGGEIGYHRFILRFNPRIKYGLFLLSRKFVQDVSFQKAARQSVRRGGVKVDEDFATLLHLESGLLHDFPQG